MNRIAYTMLMVAGCFGFVAGVTPAVKLGRALAGAGSAPVDATVAGAPTGRWVTLTDARLRCDKRSVYKDSMTFFLATDASLANPFVAQFPGTVTCEAAQAKVSGAFVPDAMTLADQAQFGIDSGGASGLRLFTPLATPRYLKAALLPFVAIALLGAGLALFGLRGVLRRGADARP